MPVDDETIFRVLQHQHEERSASALELMAWMVALTASRLRSESRDGSIIVSIDDAEKFAKAHDINFVAEASGNMLITWKPKETPTDDAGLPKDA